VSAYLHSAEQSDVVPSRSIRAPILDDGIPCRADTNGSSGGRPELFGGDVVDPHSGRRHTPAAVAASGAIRQKSAAGKWPFHQPRSELLVERANRGAHASMPVALRRVDRRTTSGYRSPRRTVSGSSGTLSIDARAPEMHWRIELRSRARHGRLDSVKASFSHVLQELEIWERSPVDSVVADPGRGSRRKTDSNSSALASEW